MNEYREIVKVHPVRLYKEDLCELERVVKDGFECPGELFKITAEFGTKRASAGSIQELLGRGPLKEPDSLHITAMSRKEPPKIDADLSIDIVRGSFVHYQLAANSETVFYGKRGQLDAFFKNCRPWYGGAKRFSRIVLPNAALYALLGALVFAVRHDWLSAILLALTTLVLTRVSFDESKGKLFPYARVVFGERPTLPSKYQMALAALNIAVVLCTIVRVILALARK